MLRLLLLLTLFTSLAHGEVYEPKPGTPERKAIMDALRLPVSTYVGTPVTFTGTVEVSGTWAKFTGGAAATDGKAPKTDKADEMELDLFALLRKEDGAWKVLSWAFSGDISAYQDALKKFPKAPRDLMPPLE